MISLLGLEHKDVVTGALRRQAPVTCELSFPSLFAWRGARRMRILPCEDGVILFRTSAAGIILFGPPLCDAAMSETIARIERASGMAVIACERLPEATAHAFHGTDFELIEDRDNFDYVYRREDLASLAGRDYHTKRNLLAQCLAAYACSYETLTPGLIPELKDMQQRWCATRACDETPGLCHEYRAIMDILDHAHELPVLGGAVRIAGRVEAFTIGSPLNNTTVAVHFEKAMPHYKGLYQVVNQWFCRHELGSYEFVNREQDIGSPGLRQAKESYHPDHMIRKYLALRGISREEYQSLRTHDARCKEEGS